MSELTQWLGKIMVAKSASEIFDILDEFRPLKWGDDERALMSRAYVKQLSRLNANEAAPANKRAVGRTTITGKEVAASSENSKAVSLNEEDLLEEDVWYEKM